MKKKLILLMSITIVLLYSCENNKKDIATTEENMEVEANRLVPNISKSHLDSLNTAVKAEFEKLRPQSIRPAEGFIKYDYLIPAGFYKQMWDWDGFFIGVHLMSLGQPEYLKYWVLNFAVAADKEGYVPGCVTTKGPRPLFGKFAMKPFIGQGTYLASEKLKDYTWITPEVYGQIKNIINYRETISLDHKYGLFYWDDAMSSGGDNNVVLSNDKNQPGAILAVDLSAFMYREYVAMKNVSAKLGHIEDAIRYDNKAKKLKENITKYLWDDKAKSFWNMYRTGRPYKRVSYSNFIALMDTDLVSQENGQEMIKRYLWNKNHMLAAYGLRSLSKQDPDYNNENIIVPYSNWQGPVWPIANYMYYVALKNYGFNEECKQLASTLGTLVLKDIEEYGSMHENYHADTGAPLAPTADQSKGGVFTGFVGWNLLVQNIVMGESEGEPLLIQIN